MFDLDPWRFFLFRLTFSATSRLPLSFELMVCWNENYKVVNRIRTDYKEQTNGSSSEGKTCDVMSRSNFAKGIPCLL
jgi:hypothetical protein